MDAVDPELTKETLSRRTELFILEGDVLETAASLLGCWKLWNDEYAPLAKNDMAPVSPSAFLVRKLPLEK